MEAVPKVTREISKTSAKEQYSSFEWEWLRFEDSGTILACRERTVRLSLDNGENWRTTLKIEEDIEQVIPDEFHGRNRAFVEDVVGHLYVTESQGREWRQIQKPLEVEKAYPNILKTHPLERNYLLLDLNVPVKYGNFNREREDRMYISEDCGRSFKRIFAPVEDNNLTQDDARHGTDCWFAVSSCNSTLSRDLIYGLHSITTTDEQGFMISENNTFFYSSDLGKTTKLVKEFNGLTVSDLQIFSSGVLVTTAEDNYNKIPTKKLWVSTGGPFKEAILPIELKHTSFGKGFENDFGRVLLPVYTAETGLQGKLVHLLIWDYLTFRLSHFDSILLNPTGSLTIKKFGNCSRTLWGQLFDVFPQDKQAQKCLSMLICDNKTTCRKGFLKYVNVISFNSGDTWSKPKLTDPSNKYKHLIKCDTNDLENCSLHIFHYTHSEKNKSMENVIMAKGAVLHSNPKFDENRCMTFISRDGGANWELAFEFPAYSVFANVGNIIVAIPQQQKEFEKFCITKILFSLDQGKTWGHCDIGEPVVAGELELDTSNSSVIVKFNRLIDANDFDRYNSVLCTLDFSQLLSVQ
ncbi:hypothetical protein ZYGR_0AD00480 [Zygosaccharomyces rouxii]|uniref:VPS10 domain-containing protein n=1 Tax=Zygosaccharomyces rouxii TaxID=4956 RepID=A0A1Q3A557_ZYGRO|nr:hypothetical protein ZYGR_0AD00480 [Zygosaccharomyces rouxii]